jgi:hypothetical protein
MKVSTDRVGGVKPYIKTDDTSQLQEARHRKVDQHRAADRPPVLPGAGSQPLDRAGRPAQALGAIVEQGAALILPLRVGASSHA